MLYRTLAAALIAGCVPFAVIAQTQTSPPVSTEAARPADTKPEAPPVAGKSYVPGLETFMGVIQGQHAKLWYAGRARNWPLAEYELGEIKEVMGDVQDLIPKFKDLPLADMLDAVIIGEIAALEKAIEKKDVKGFAAGYDKLTAACNTCHEATGNPAIVLRRPRGPAFPNQDFRPRQTKG